MRRKYQTPKLERATTRTTSEKTTIVPTDTVLIVWYDYVRSAGKSPRICLQTDAIIAIMASIVRVGLFFGPLLSWGWTMALWSKRFVAVVAGFLTLSLTIPAAGQTGKTMVVSGSVSTTFTIKDVVVAEAGPLRNGKLEANEPLVITWAAASQTGSVTTQVLTIDGQVFSAIHGPYGGLYYYCPIGVIAAGQHTYAIEATDSNNTSAATTGSFDVTAAAGPTIASVVVAEATAPRDGSLALNKKLVIT